MTLVRRKSGPRGPDLLPRSPRHGSFAAQDSIGKRLQKEQLHEFQLKSHQPFSEPWIPDSFFTVRARIGRANPASRKELRSMMRTTTGSLSLLLLIFAIPCAIRAEEHRDEIQVLLHRFQLGEGGPNGFAPPGLWADADPAQHVAWYKALGVNVIQTFCVSCNGYAWYKNGVVPEQPGLKYDFLPETVRFGHKEGLRVMGYFCIGSNTKWGKDHPAFSYGIPSRPHLPYTGEYLPT